MKSNAQCPWQKDLTLMKAWKASFNTDILFIMIFVLLGFSLAFTIPVKVAPDILFWFSAWTFNVPRSNSSSRSCIFPERWKPCTWPWTSNWPSWGWPTPWQKFFFNHKRNIIRACNIGSALSASSCVFWKKNSVPNSSIYHYYLIQPGTSTTDLGLAWKLGSSWNLNET